MPEAKYINTEALSAYTEALSKKFSRVYNAKGSAIYADTAYLASANKASPAIDSVGLWQQVDGNWAKITSFLPSWVYNITNGFTTDSNFVDGGGVKIVAGTNIAVINQGTEQNPVLKFDLLAVGIDTSDLEQAVSQLQSTVADKADASDLATLQSTVAGKADASDLATLQSTVAGKADASDLATLQSTVAGKADASDVPDVTDKQDKELSAESDIIVPDHTVADATARAALTTSTVSDGDVAFQEDTEEYYYAEVESNTIIWYDIGNTKTVEGAIKLIGSLMPIKPISTSEIQAMFA